MGTSEQEVSRARSMFSEQDQTDLYNQAQTSKSQGRIGLGQSQQPKKIAGARWKGTKTKLSEASDDEISEQVRVFSARCALAWCRAPACADLHCRSKGALHRMCASKH